MDARRWLEQVRHELGRQKLPRRYVKRLVLELSDHLTDYMEDSSMSTDAQESQTIVDRLGMPNQIAQRAAFEYRQERFPARHPWLIFAALPVVLLPLLWIVAFLGFLALVLIDDWIGFELHTPLPLWGKLLVSLVFYGVIQLPIVLSAAFVCHLAKRGALSWKWPMLGCLLLAGVSIQLCPVVHKSTTNDGTWVAYFATPYLDADLGDYSIVHLSRLSRPARVAQIFQFALPLLIGVWAARRQANDHRYRLVA